MFTGLVQHLGKVTAAGSGARRLRLTVELGKLAEQVKIGDSVAVNGLCLTAVALRASQADFDVSAESLASSTIGQLPAQTAVNLELAMGPGGRFGGHFVQGHVDGTAVITNIAQQGGFWQFEFAASADLLKMMVPKGSVAVDGISLTVAHLREDSFAITIIPETYNSTNLKFRRPGDKVNIETDLIIKAVARQLGQLTEEPGDTPLTVEKLRQLGF